LRFVAQPVVPNKQHNKALHPTAYSFARSSLRFRRRVSLVVVLLARSVSVDATFWWLIE